MVNLKQAIDQKDTFRACSLIAERFSNGTPMAHQYQTLHVLARSLESQIQSKTEPGERFDALLSGFYRQLAFSGNEKDFFCSRYSLLDHVVQYRTGIPVTLAVVFSHLAGFFGLPVQGVNFPGHFLMRFQLKRGTAVFVDPLNGQKLSWEMIEKRYFHIIQSAEGEQMPIEALNAASTEEIVVRLLHNLKAAFINENQFHLALEASGLLIQLCPNDPYERRDRGFLLHQLECPQVAFADYQYFVKHCPDDPSARLLKQQINQWDSSGALVFH